MAAAIEEANRSARVDWPTVRAAKRAGIALAFARFLRDEWRRQSRRARHFSAFMQVNRSWLDDHALFSVLHAEQRVSWMDWPAMARDDFSWIRARAGRAGEIFSLLRVDHVLGFYRTFSRSRDGKVSGFSPGDEWDQIQLGEKLMRIMSRFEEVVAEDLGPVPPYLRPSLERVGIPGYRLLRWERDGDGYRDPTTWPATSVATNATHDTDTTAVWYDGLTPAEREQLSRLPSLSGLDPARPFDDRARDLLLAAIYAAPSTLALIPFQDAMGTRERINVPGTVDEANWRYRAARGIDELLADDAEIERLRKLAEEAGRLP
jgi:4-alpha-glucanotransferase